MELESHLVMWLLNALFEEIKYFRMIFRILIFMTISILIKLISKIPLVLWADEMNGLYMNIPKHNVRNRSCIHYYVTISWVLAANTISLDKDILGIIRPKNAPSGTSRRLFIQDNKNSCPKKFKFLDANLNGKNFNWCYISFPGKIFTKDCLTSKFVH